MTLTARPGVLFRGSSLGPLAVLVAVIVVVVFVIVVLGRAGALVTSLGVLLAGATTGAAVLLGPRASGRAEVAFLVLVFILHVIGFATASAVGGLAPLAGDLSLFFGVHGGEATAAVLVSLGAVAVGLAGVAIGVLHVARGVMPRRLSMVMGGGFVMERRVAVVRGSAPLRADLGHVAAVATDRFAPLTPGLGGLLGIKLMRVAARMRNPPAFASDLALFFRIHGGETPPALFGHDALSLVEKGISPPNP